MALRLRARRLCRARDACPLWRGVDPAHFSKGRVRAVRRVIGKSTAASPASATGDRNGRVDVRAALEVIEDGFR